MKKIALLFLCIATACVGPTGGIIPKGKEKTPDMTSKYVVSGAWFNSSKNEKLDYPDFANKKCRDAGFSGYEAYQVSAVGSARMEIGGLPLPVNDSTKDVKIWCKK